MQSLSQMKITKGARTNEMLQKTMHDRILKMRYGPSSCVSDVEIKTRL